MSTAALAGVESREDDAELVARAQRGDRAAFAVLLEAHYERIYRLAYRWCGHREDAEDVAQEVAIKLAGALKGFDGRSAFTSWLYRIVLNAVRDRQRQGQRRMAQARALALVAEDEAPPEQEAGLEDAALWAAVRTLPDKQREAVILVYAEDMSHAEAGTVMGIKEGTVSWYLAEARKTLRTVL